jgi:cobalt-zinc-cadmium efflux system protein
LISLADAGQNLSDVLGLLLAWGANYLCQRQPAEHHTDGWHKSTIAELYHCGGSCQI